MKSKEIRQNLLEKLGGKPIDFIKKIEESTIEVIETKNQSLPNTLQKVIIKDIPHDQEAYICIWRINLEREISGLASISGAKTPEIALVVFKNSAEGCLLDVYLIELKSKLGDKELEKCSQKMKDSINRFYFLMVLLDKYQTEDFQNAEVRFAGLIFYNGQDAVSSSRFSEMAKVLFSSNQIGKIEINSILQKDKIPIQFFKNFDSTTQSITVSFQDLEKIWQ